MDNAAKPVRTVFLFDVDNTLFDNDSVIADLKQHLDHEVGPDGAARYWKIFEGLREELGYADYLGALQRYRGQYPHDLRILMVSCFLVDYPFSKRVFENALEAIETVRRWNALPVILSDGDVVFQPLKIARSGLLQAVSQQALIYIHKEKELSDVERRYPADHYVLVDDKLRILTAVKQVWGKRVTTVFVRQGHYAHDTEHVNPFPAADLAIERIGDLLEHEPNLATPRAR